MEVGRACPEAKFTLGPQHPRWSSPKLIAHFRQSILLVSPRLLRWLTDHREQCPNPFHETSLGLEPPHSPWLSVCLFPTVNRWPPISGRTYPRLSGSGSFPRYVFRIVRLLNFRSLSKTKSDTESDTTLHHHIVPATHKSCKVLALNNFGA